MDTFLFKGYKEINKTYKNLVTIDVGEKNHRTVELFNGAYCFRLNFLNCIAFSFYKLSQYNFFHP